MPITTSVSTRVRPVSSWVAAPYYEGGFDPPRSLVSGSRVTLLYSTSTVEGLHTVRENSPKVARPKIKVAGTNATPTQDVHVQGGR